MDTPALRRLLLDLISTTRQPDLNRLSGLVVDEWLELDTMAAVHRLQPLLHSLHRSTAAIPADLRDGWRLAHRQAAISSLVQRSELTSTVALLRSHGIEPLALKGGWLAWQAYPEAAQRPMRDIDLLVTLDDFPQTVEVLRKAGYPDAWPAEMPLEDLLCVDKSPPPMVAPRGTAIELHFHAWFPEGRLGYPSPAPDDAGLFDRSILEADGIRYMTPTDLLAHLVIHAVYSHRLDCGPLLLPDIDFLLRSRAIDWNVFWSRAVDGAYVHGAQLVLFLVKHYRGSPVEWLEHRPGAAILTVAEQAPDLLLQNLDTRLSASFAARMRLDVQSGALWRSIRATLAGSRRTAAGQEARRRFSGPADFATWIVSRVRRSAGQLAKSEVRDQARSMEQFTRFIRNGS